MVFRGEGGYFCSKEFCFSFFFFYLLESGNSFTSNLRAKFADSGDPF